MRRKTTSQFIHEAKEVHGDKYDYSEVIYINNNTKVKIKCPIHGFFEQLPKTHIHRQYGCPYCSGKASSTEIFIQKAKEIHGDKYNYSLVNYSLKNNPVKIICDIHGIFEQTPDHHVNSKCGCPKCIKRSYPKSEQDVEQYLISNNIIFEHQKEFEGCINTYQLSFDFFLPKYNLCIECDGKQHFTPIEFFGGIKGFEIRKKCDNIKTIFCKDNGIRLLRIPYTEFYNIDSILKSELN